MADLAGSAEISIHDMAKCVDLSFLLEESS